MSAGEPIAVSVVTGFLGAGKTTLLNRLLKSPDLLDTAIIVNEFGEVGIDHLLVEASGDGLIELSDGCLCCTVRGQLVDTLADLVDRVQTGRIARLKRIVIETTGLADPAPVLHAVMGHPALVQTLRLDGVVTVVDAVHGAGTLHRHREAARQVAVADRLVLTKAGIAGADAVGTVVAALRRLNPGAPLLDADRDAVEPATLLSAGLYDPETKIADVAGWLRDEALAGDHHHHHHDVTRHGGAVRSFAITHDRPIDPAALDMFVDLLRSTQAETLLRMKAIVCLADDPGRPLVLHGVQSIFHPPARLPAWPDPSDRRTRLVIIADGLSEDYVRDLFAAFTGAPRIDRPDRTALSDNPLAIPGMPAR